MTNAIRLLLTGVFCWCWCALAMAGDGGLRRVEGPCHFSFPQDHGAHEHHRTEWWYYTGNLDGEDGGRWGFQLTFFRTRLDSRPSAEAPRTTPQSAWRTPHVYLAHMAVTDIDGRRHAFAEDMARGALDIAGAERHGDAVTVWVKKWRMTMTPAVHRLDAATESLALDLTLTPRKPPVAHGDGGYSRKGRRPEQASCYYSFTRLSAEGTLHMGGRKVRVSGLAWMDHEYATAPLDPALEGWDWFSLQLEDGTDVMLYRLRGKDGGAHPASSGSIVSPTGDVRRVLKNEFSVTPEDFWKSPETGARYPVRWSIRLPWRRLSLEVSAPVASQEMRTGRSTGVTYWEGSVAVTGTDSGRPVNGRGYVEMTGYAGAFDAPL